MLVTREPSAGWYIGPPAFPPPLATQISATSQAPAAGRQTSPATLPAHDCACAARVPRTSARRKRAPTHKACCDRPWRQVTVDIVLLEECDRDLQPIVRSLLSIF